MTIRTAVVQSSSKSLHKNKEKFMSIPGVSSNNRVLCIFPCCLVSLACHLKRVWSFCVIQSPPNNNIHSSLVHTVSGLEGGGLLGKGDTLKPIADDTAKFCLSTSSPAVVTPLWPVTEPLSSARTWSCLDWHAGISSD